MNGADRHDEPQSIGGRHFTAAPFSRQGDGVLRRDQSGVCGGQRLGAQEVLLDPAEPGASKCRGIDANQRLESGIGRFGDKNGADAGCDVFRA